MEHSGRRNRIVGRVILAGILALVLAGFVALSAHARGTNRDGREPSADRQAARMAERLGLSAEQKAQVREILTQGVAQRTEIREEGRKKLEALREETEKRLSGVLTPEQMTKLRQFREERRERRRDCGPRHGGRHGGFHDGPPPDHD